MLFLTNCKGFSTKPCIISCYNWLWYHIIHCKSHQKFIVKSGKCTINCSTTSELVISWRRLKDLQRLLSAKYMMCIKQTLLMQQGIYFSPEQVNQKQCHRQAMCSTSGVHYQAMVWRNAHYARPELPSPLDMGWKHGDSGLQPILMSQNLIPESCLEMFLCACKKQCTTRQCKCRKSGLLCTAMCACQSDDQCPFLYVEL